MTTDDLDDICGPPALGHSHNRPQTVTEAELAAFWGVGSRLVRTLLSEGVIQKTNDRQYDLQMATQAYVQRLITSAKIRGGADPELKAEKLRLAREQADKLALQNAVVRGEYVSASEVKQTWFYILRDVRSAMLALPTRVQARLPHLTTHDTATLDSEIRKALTDIGDGND